MVKRLFFKIKNKIKYLYFKGKITLGIYNNKSVIIEVKNKDRRTGKTTLIKEISKKYDAPVLVRYANQQNTFKQDKINRVIHVPCKEYSRGIRSKNFFLIEEGFSKEEIEYLKKFNKIYGFYYKG